MTHTFNGASIDAQPPISTISVNKFNVVFKDSKALKIVSFQNSGDTKKFLNWLITI
ncbi:hypothetical protein [Thalassotalea aquiviva]|uniref:hypothetical protein n=1 Tax=Thalassotalea aquiviva TaxID=3242415 RepID=UPI00352A690C